jgi:hypothetical protein
MPADVEVRVRSAQGSNLHVSGNKSYNKHVKGVHIIANVPATSLMLKNFAATRVSKLESTEPARGFRTLKLSSAMNAGLKCST